MKEKGRVAECLERDTASRLILRLCTMYIKPCRFTTKSWAGLHACMHHPSTCSMFLDVRTLGRTQCQYNSVCRRACRGGGDEDEYED